MLVEYILYMHFLRVFSRFFLTPSPGILARSPGILAPSPGVEFLRLYFWISLGLVAPIALRNFTQAAAKLSWRHPASSQHILNWMMPAPATAPAPFRNCLAKAAGVSPHCKKTSSEKNHPHKNTRTVPNRNGWLQEAMEGKFLSKHTRNKCQNTLQASQVEPLPPSECHRNPKNACRNKFSHQIQQAEEFQHQ